MTDLPSLEGYESSHKLGANETHSQNFYPIANSPKPYNLTQSPKTKSQNPLPNTHKTQTQNQNQQNKNHKSQTNQNLKRYSLSFGIDLTDDELLEVTDSLFYLGRAIARYCQMKEEEHAS